MGPSKVKLAEIRLTSYSDPSVYDPSEDSFAIVDAMAASIDIITQPPPLMCLEIGCGSGYVICSLALMLAQTGCHAECFATDLSTSATAACVETLSAHNVKHVDVLRMDLLSALLPRIRGKVDILVFNPPYVPTPDEEVPPSQWVYDADGCRINAAWAGGWKGRVVIDRVLPLVDEVLSPNGHFFMVTVLENEPEEILKDVTSRTGLHGRIALQQSADEEMLKILHFSRRPLPAATSTSR